MLFIFCWRNKTRIRGPGFDHKPMNPTQSPPLGLLLQVYRGLVCKHKQRRDKFTKRLRIRPSFNSPPDRLSLLPRFTVEQRQTTGSTATQAE